MDEIVTAIIIGVVPHPRRAARVLRNPTRLLSDMVVETSQAAGGVKATYACQVCHRAYERLDHLNRHLDSRKYITKNTRSFVCSVLMVYRPEREVIQMFRMPQSVQQEVSYCQSVVG